MLIELDRESSKIGSIRNLSKTKTMCHGEVKIRVSGKEIGNLKSYVYLGHKITLRTENQTTEINRRRRLAWASFEKLRTTLKNKNILLWLRT